MHETFSIKGFRQQSEYFVDFITKDYVKKVDANKHQEYCYLEYNNVPPPEKDYSRIYYLIEKEMRNKKTMVWI